MTLGVRPEAVGLGEDGAEGGTIDDLEPHGRETIYHLATESARFAASKPARRRASGSATRVEFSLDRALLFDANGRRIADADLKLAA